MATVYRCDSCGQEGDKPNFVFHLEVPGVDYHLDYEENQEYGRKVRADLCGRCMKKVHKAMEKEAKMAPAS